MALKLDPIGNFHTLSVIIPNRKLDVLAPDAYHTRKLADRISQGSCLYDSLQDTIQDIFILPSSFLPVRNTSSLMTTSHLAVITPQWQLMPPFMSPGRNPAPIVSTLSSGSSLGTIPPPMPSKDGTATKKSDTLDVLYTSSTTAIYVQGGTPAPHELYRCQTP